VEVHGHVHVLEVSLAGRVPELPAHTNIGRCCHLVLILAERPISLNEILLKLFSTSADKWRNRISNSAAAAAF
jgi:hypothetical protein